MAGVASRMAPSRAPYHYPGGIVLGNVRVNEQMLMEVNGAGLSLRRAPMRARVAEELG